MIHHIELWVPNLNRAEASWGWLLSELGYQPFVQWPEGQSWQMGTAYIVLEQSPDRVAGRHDRCRPGMNHLAFHVGSREEVDKLVDQAPQHGWRLLFQTATRTRAALIITRPTWRTGTATRSSLSRRPLYRPAQEPEP